MPIIKNNINNIYIFYIMNTQDNEIQLLKQEIIMLKEKLKKYTAPIRSKTYYENHREQILERVKQYPLTKEQIKEKNKKAAL